MNSVVTFNINDQTMGVDMLNVDRIINLKKKFKFSSEVVVSDSNVIIIANENRKCGIIADNINDIVDVSNVDIVETPNNNYIYGVVKVNDVIINLLSSNSLILDCIL